MLKARWSVLVVSILQSLIILHVQGDNFRQTIDSGNGLTTCSDTSLIDRHISQKALLQSDYVRRASEEGRPAREGHKEKPSKELDSRKGGSTSGDNTPGAKQSSAFKFTTPRPTGLPPVFSSATKRQGKDKAWKKEVDGKQRQRIRLPSGWNVTTGKGSKWTGSKLTSPRVKAKGKDSKLPKEADILKEKNVARVNDLRMATQPQKKSKQTQLQPPTLPPSLLEMNETDSNHSVQSKAEILLKTADHSVQSKAERLLRTAAASQPARNAESNNSQVSVNQSVSLTVKELVNSAAASQSARHAENHNLTVSANQSMSAKAKELVSSVNASRRARPKGRHNLTASANQLESEKVGEGANQTGASQPAQAMESSDVALVSVHDDIADPDCEPGGQCVHGHLAKKSPHRALCVVSSVLATTKMCWDICNLAHEPEEYFAGINRSGFPKETAVKALLDLRQGVFSEKVKCPNPNPSAHANKTEREFWLAEAKDISVPTSAPAYVKALHDSVSPNTSMPASAMTQVSECTGGYQSYAAKAHPGCGYEDWQTKEGVTVEDAQQYCCTQSWCTGFDHYADQGNKAYYCSEQYDANQLVSMEPSTSFRKSIQAVNALTQTNTSMPAKVSMAANASVTSVLGVSSKTVAAIVLDLPDPGCKLAGPCSNSTLPELRGVCVQPTGTADEKTRQCWDVCNTSHPPQDYFRGDPSANLLVKGIENVRKGFFSRVLCPHHQMDHTDFPLHVDVLVEKVVDAVNDSATTMSPKSRKALDMSDRDQQRRKRHAKKAESSDLRHTAHIFDDATKGQKKLTEKALSDAMEGNSAAADNLAREEEKEQREDEAKSLQALAKYRQELAEIKREELNKALAAAGKAELELKRLKQSEAEAELEEETSGTDKLALAGSSPDESSWAAETELQPFSSGQPTVEMLTDQSLQAAAQKAVRTVSPPSTNASVKASMPAVKRESLAAIQSGSSLMQTAQLEAQMQDAAQEAETEELKALKEAERQAEETEKFVKQEEKEIKEELFDSVVGQYNKNRQRLEKDLFTNVGGIFGESKHREDEDDIGNSIYKPHKKRHRKKSHSLAQVSTASGSDDAAVDQAPAEEAGKPKLSFLAQWLR